LDSNVKTEESKWHIHTDAEELNIIDELNAFARVSAQIEPKSLSDLRLL
jgi:hypothetical protein